MKVFKDEYYSGEIAASKSFDAYIPESERFEALIYFHGGGLVCGDKKDAEVFSGELVKNKIALFSVNYRMYPSSKYPDFIEDSAQAVAYIIKNSHRYGKINRVFVGGSSAGGYLSMMLCFDKKYLSVYGLKPTDIYAFIHDAGQPTAHFNVLKDRGMDNRRVIVDETSALYHVGEDKILPKMLFIVSDNDMQNRYEQTMLMLSTLKHFGFTEGITLKVMHGGHCEYVGKVVDGKSVFGELLVDYILNN